MADKQSQEGKYEESDGYDYYHHIIGPKEQPPILRIQLIKAIKNRDYKEVDSIAPLLDDGWDLCANMSASAGDLNMLKHAELHGAKNYNDWMYWATMHCKINIFCYAVDKGGNDFKKCIIFADDCSEIYDYCKSQLDKLS